MGKNEQIEQVDAGGWKGNRLQTNQKHLAFSMLVAQGVAIPKAAEMLGFKPSYGYNLAQKVREKSETLALADDVTFNAAKRVVKRCMAGKPWGNIDKIRASDALHAAGMVIDRRDPKKSDQPPPTVSFTTINLNLVKPDHPDAIDISDYPPKSENGEGADAGNEPKMVGNDQWPQ